MSPTKQSYIEYKAQSAPNDSTSEALTRAIYAGFQINRTREEKTVDYHLSFQEAQAWIGSHPDQVFVTLRHSMHCH